MIDPSHPFDAIFIVPILNLLVFFYTIFLAIKLPGAFGFAIIALTVLVRLILHPLFQKQLHTAKKMQELKPHLDRLSTKHKQDPKTLQQQQLKLYQEAGINPASGCVFLIIQIPIFIALYRALQFFLTGENMKLAITSFNKMLYFPFLKIASIDPQFFGFNLALTPAQAGQWYYYLIPVITGFLQYYQVAVSVPKQQEGLVKKDESQKSTTGEDFQKAMNTQMKYIFPILIGWFSFQFPVGLSLYWNIFSIFSIMQYKNMHK
ncbi:hypothetical protein A3G67_01650 [Candidatus Roizmanbacteria bacterium RIFCSPLOWO2_12_FULL_40_12]|uniref:Membrane insertase YidC/Oxa/ALB C-terminal domain-containing protein n=1 Tax=Candidatus Roizmanbacteria bacterium RIFCSPLOWO2_01_FULL_40_42 TaxID=1802066 RepID=A0A1F7J5U0_9BACT|nr:MAG: hypothetical protein A2779_02165 [Candidatus Roizmanbacteria bacterium RIFCSPHIGHO2_01_FULL_40_98]OGK28813.1 MAG: hypothetical protein A3C31_04330 [Candidatus Roizmanbacteria bacterium RIFCSPHIGHO2_02_FULL_40_53]OGK30209.1 MAG: hypothetical protein A2W49_01305 [Candidatus Roizmanbacteria bacterium RIFCSPHIGHO2_12_41_18]OGK36865.1 MAG: hypothetical protein A3E69_01680 [Candidatus Roizmanbacteria bacterium RIFCSPHIGHO2_12_FULL_40_130]OGK50985.1 MAG: hypothetical protein A3B50_03550 [Candi